ncbi:TonB-dependent receptor [Novosphingobium sp. JCM 18896]|uniref:TonB-dependent receptor n=1 Tax=Novosphingobium sp. JCM 18896 TaxID=2989731 RepID=UPI002222C501|nr:TonB-dependent receptor [Novosphingobium sp. JCM 18896]MCW1431282.1 TonB-dependent receptor [Novosphingobium sp. JCM 18896]
MQHSKFAFLAGASALLFAVPAQAQDAASAPAAQETEARQGSAAALIDDIVVRARKKGAAERAQDVPIALTAVSGAQIEAMFAQDLTDVGMTMPNVRLDDGGAFPGVSNYTIRGMGFNSTIASVEPTVGTFVDGIYIGANLGGLQETLDLESVEVLRGPQGTLFGRNVTGGAVVMRSRRPEGEFGGIFRIGSGSGNRKVLAAGVEGPLSDTVAAKIFAQYSDYDGDWHNLTTGKRHGADETFAVRPMIRFRPSSAVDITVIGEYGKTDGDGVASRFIEDPAQLLYTQGIREPKGAENLSINFDGDTDIEWKQAVLDANVELGGGTLTSITGYRKVDYFSTGDTDGSQSETARAINKMSQHQFSSELRYAGKALDGKLDYTIGAYYFEQRMEQFYHVFFFGNSNQRSRGVLNHHTWSVFAQGDYEVVPGFFVTAGGRYTWEKKRAATGRTNECTVQLVCSLTDEGSTVWKNFAPKVGLSWKATDDVLVYASWTKGFRSGGYNIRTTGARFNPATPAAANESAGPYDQEVVKALEGGIKTEFLDGKARVNLAAFHNNYDGLQRTVNQGLVNFIANVAKATVNGVELETTFLPAPNLALTANVGYLDAKYKDYILPGTTTNLSGKQLIRAPKWTYTLAFTHDLDLGSGGVLTSRASLNYSGKTPANDPGNYFAAAYHLVDASLTWSPEGNSDFKLSAWVKNLTNEKYSLTATYVGTLFTNLYQAPPRRWGVEATYKF